MANRTYRFLPSATQLSSQQLYLTSSRDGGVLLDVRNDRLLRLNTTGIQVWILLSQGLSQHEVARRLACEYGIEQSRALTDVETVLASAARLALDPRMPLTVIPEEARDVGGGGQQHESYPWYGQTDNDTRPAPPALLVLQALVILLWVDILLFLCSFEELCTRVKLWPVRSGVGEPSHDVVGKVCAAVELACVWYPRRALCLQRSALTTCLMRSHGVCAQMVIGVKATPFLAHAWVEVSGAVVNDWPQVKKAYSVMTAY